MKTTFKALLLTTTILSLAGCFGEDSTEQETSKASKHMEYVQQEIKKPLNVKTVSGSYLIAQHAQISNDWETASLYMNRVLGEHPSVTPEMKDALEKRAMILNLGAGKVDTAYIYAKNFSKKKENPLSRLVLSLPPLRAQNFDLAMKEIEKMSVGGVSDLIKPIVKNWILFGQGKTPDIKKNVSGQELYHLMLGADYAGDAAYIKKISDVPFSKAGLTNQALLHVADILLRHDLSGRALSIYQDVHAQIQDNEALNKKLTLLENGETVPEEMLFKSIKFPHIGVSMALFDIGMLLFQEQSLDSARIFAYLSLNLNPALEEANLLLAYIATDYKAYDEAIDFFKTITTNDTQRYARAQQHIADLQERAGDYEGALGTLENLLLQQKDIALQIQIGDISRQNEKYKDALKAYNKAFEMIEGDISQEHWSLYYSRGIVFERLDQWNKAEDDFQKALGFEPDHPYVLNYLGYSWADQGKNLEDALNMITKAVKLRPEDAYIVDSLGWVYFKLEKFNQAVAPLEKAVALFPGDPTINDHLGDAYWKVGRKHEARFQWSRALSFAEEDPENLSEEESQELVTQLKGKLKTGL